VSKPPRQRSARLSRTEQKVFREIFQVRYGKASTAVRRHTQGNVHVAEQTATTAKVRAYMLISTVPDAEKLQVLTTGTYNAELQKREGRWVITRWYIEVDVPLAASSLPPGPFEGGGPVDSGSEAGRRGDSFAKCNKSGCA
jgi:hypothetical protein